MSTCNCTCAASSDPSPLEAILPPIALALFVVYMTIYYVLLATDPFRVNLGLKMWLRRRWAHGIVRENASITAVQTLRNTQNAASVFASAAVVVAFFAFQQGSNLTNAGQSLQGIKFYVLGATFVGGFLSFGMSIREAENCGFIAFHHEEKGEFDNIEIPLTHRSVESDAKLRREMMIVNMGFRARVAAKSASLSFFFWNLGLRFFYFAVCIGGWIASPIACIPVTVAVLIVMIILDRTSVSGMEGSKSNWF